MGLFDGILDAFDPSGKSIQGFLGNVPESAQRMAGGLVDLAGAGAQAVGHDVRQLMPGSDPEDDGLDFMLDDLLGETIPQVASYYKENYLEPLTSLAPGGVPAGEGMAQFGNYAYEDPTGLAFDALGGYGTLKGAGVAGRALRKLGDVPGGARRALRGEEGVFSFGDARKQALAQAGGEPAVLARRQQLMQELQELDAKEARLQAPSPEMQQFQQMQQTGVNQALPQHQEIKMRLELEYPPAVVDEVMDFITDNLPPEEATAMTPKALRALATQTEQYMRSRGMDLDRAPLQGFALDQTRERAGQIRQEVGGIHGLEDMLTPSIEEAGGHFIPRNHPTEQAGQWQTPPPQSGYPIEKMTPEGRAAIAGSGGGGPTGMGTYGPVDSITLARRMLDDTAQLEWASSNQGTSLAAANQVQRLTPEQLANDIDRWEQAFTEREGFAPTPEQREAATRRLLQGSLQAQKQPDGVFAGMASPEDVGRQAQFSGGLYQEGAKGAEHLAGLLPDETAARRQAQLGDEIGNAPGRVLSDRYNHETGLPVEQSKRLGKTADEHMAGPTRRNARFNVKRATRESLLADPVFGKRLGPLGDPVTLKASPWHTMSDADLIMAAKRLNLTDNNELGIYEPNPSGAGPDVPSQRMLTNEGDITLSSTQRIDLLRRINDERTEYGRQLQEQYFEAATEFAKTKNPALVRRMGGLKERLDQMRNAEIRANRQAGVDEPTLYSEQELFRQRRQGGSRDRTTEQERQPGTSLKDQAARGLEGMNRDALIARAEAEGMDFLETINKTDEQLIDFVSRGQGLARQKDLAAGFAPDAPTYNARELESYERRMKREGVRRPRRERIGENIEGSTRRRSEQQRSRRLQENYLTPAQRAERAKAEAARNAPAETPVEEATPAAAAPEEAATTPSVEERFKQEMDLAVEAMDFDRIQKISEAWKAYTSVGKVDDTTVTRGTPTPEDAPPPQAAGVVDDTDVDAPRTDIDTEDFVGAYDEAYEEASNGTYGSSYPTKKMVAERLGVDPADAGFLAQWNQTVNKGSRRRNAEGKGIGAANKGDVRRRSQQAAPKADPDAEPPRTRRSQRGVERDWQNTADRNVNLRKAMEANDDDVLRQIYEEMRSDPKQIHAQRGYEYWKKQMKKRVEKWQTKGAYDPKRYV